MGLDQYLYKETDVGYDKKYEEALSAFHKLGMKPKSVTEEVAYWRKANHIHNWFVKNVQNGVDDCGTYDVSTDNLLELIKLCESVLEKRDDEFSKANLPTTSGFFFGSTEYDEYYYSDVEHTIGMLKPLVDVDFFEYGLSDFKYHSSW
jgi:hypothetical protein